MSWHEDVTKVSLKAELAKKGASLDVNANLTNIELPKEGEPVNVLVLDRVVKGELPEYCTHGYASCIRCGELCWIGHATEQVLIKREAYAICLECATETIPPDTPATARVEDHLRKDGPHD